MSKMNVFSEQSEPRTAISSNRHFSNCVSKFWVLKLTFPRMKNERIVKLTLIKLIQNNVLESIHTSQS